jgi:transcriptional regulator with XRE-family HTH domain
MTANTNICFEDWEADQMKDPEFRAAVEELEPAYQVARLRIMRGLTQEQVAELVGTKQSSIARLESGNTEPRLSFLRRVVEALGGQLEVRIMPQEEAIALARPFIPTTDVELQNEGESEWHRAAMVPVEMVFVPPETD